tara:strand:+ start:1596 stop:1850 length:255 start_codon:yes stop_codon:yes gene_type:complete
MTHDDWDYFDPQPNEGVKADDTDILYAKVFKSEEGQRVLSHMRSITIELPTWYPGEDASYGYVREGMADMVRMIQKRLERSENV